MGLAANCAIAGFAELVAKLAEKYRSKGTALLSAAMDAKSVDEHDRLLYEAGLLVYLANRLYSGMAEDPRTGLSADTREKYSKFAEVAEEAQVRICTALLNSLRNRTGKLFRSQRLGIGRTREKKGQKGVDDEIFQIVERHYSYPRSYKRLLADISLPNPWKTWLAGHSKQLRPP